MLKEHDRVVLTADFPEHRLKAGDLGVIALVHGQGEGYEVEIFTVNGQTYDVITVAAGQVRPVGQLEIAHARPVK
ncbi:MAG: DUF4926 domain-containing protein [Anaerolineae bacterium]|nr:DUF4926 domain-containing protein [Anaerolineae bacterium]